MSIPTSLAHRPSYKRNETGPASQERQNEMKLFLWKYSKQKTYRRIGIVSGKTFGDVIIQASKFAAARGFTHFRPDNENGYFENEIGEQLFMRRKETE